MLSKKRKLAQTLQNRYQNSYKSVYYLLVLEREYYDKLVYFTFIEEVRIPCLLSIFPHVIETIIQNYYHESYLIDDYGCIIGYCVGPGIIIIKKVKLNFNLAIEMIKRKHRMSYSNTICLPLIDNIFFYLLLKDDDYYYHHIDYNFDSDDD